MSKITVVSPANIAFIKFWGKKDPKLNIPFNNSISMNLSDCYTQTTVDFDPKYKKDNVFIDGKKLKQEKEERVIHILNLVRKMSNKNLFAQVLSTNNFPSDAGIASSASAFSALALAASKAIGLNLGKKELSILARLGSGSASRSIPDGFSEWKKGTNNETSYAVSIASQNFWDLRDIVVVVSKSAKKNSSTEGHSVAETSPYFRERQKRLGLRIKKLRSALLAKNFKTFGELVEEEAVDLHVMAMTSHPPVFYWDGGTMEVIHAVRDMREDNIFCYFTMDAGPNVHVICLGKDINRIKAKLARLKNVIKTITNRAARGTHIING